MPEISQRVRFVIGGVGRILDSFWMLVILICNYIISWICPWETVKYGSPLKYTFDTSSDHLDGGSGGEIFKAKLLDDAGNPSNDFVAVKETFFNPWEYYANPDNFEELCRKYRSLLLKTIEHENLISYRQVRITRKRLIFRNRMSSVGVMIRLAMDYYPDGDLARYLSKLRGRGVLLDEAQGISFLHDIARGLEHLHSQGIINGDLKPNNVLVEHLINGKLKLVICDLDGYIRMKTNVTCPEDITRRQGTPGFRSPEMVKTFDARGVRRDAADPAGSALIGRKTDIWSLGCTALQIGNAIAGCKNKLHSGDHIVAIDELGQFEVEGLLENGYVPYVCDSIPPDFADVIRCCLQTDSGKRISARDLVIRLQNLKPTARAAPGGNNQLDSGDFVAYDHRVCSGVFCCHGPDNIAISNPKM